MKKEAYNYLDIPVFGMYRRLRKEVFCDVRKRLSSDEYSRHFSKINLSFIYLT